MGDKRVELQSFITSHDVGINRLASAAATLRILQNAAGNQMFVEKPSYNDVVNDGKAILVARMDIDFCGEVPLNSDVKTTTWIAPGGKLQFFRNHEMKLGDEVVTRASSQWVVVDIASRKILTIDAIDTSNFYREEVFEAISDKKFRVDKTLLDQFELVEDHTVRLSECDYNGHMNNTRYVDLMCDLIPELQDGSVRVGHLRIHFAKEAKLGEKFKVMALKQDDIYLFQTFKENGEMNIEAEIKLVPVK